MTTEPDPGNYIQPVKNKRCSKHFESEQGKQRVSEWGVGGEASDCFSVFLNPAWVSSRVGERVSERERERKRQGDW